MKTRDRILHTSLSMFNRYGEPAVSTIHIAHEMDISPGNLYYHFRNKDEISLELFKGYREQMLDVLDIPESRPLDMEDIWLLLHMMFEIIARYRFIYRNPLDLLDRIERLQRPFRQLLTRKRATIFSLCRNLQEQKKLQLNDQELSALVQNIVLSSTFWLNYQQLENGSEARDSGSDVVHGVYQVLSLIAPYLDSESRAHIEILGENYL